MTRKQFLITVIGSIVTLILASKLSFAKVFLRNSRNQTFDIDNFYISGTNVTRNSTTGYIQTVTLQDGRIYTITRDSNGYISTVTDTLHSTTITRDANSRITAWSTT